MSCIYFLVKVDIDENAFVFDLTEIWQSNGNPFFAGDGRAFYGVFRE